MTDVNMIGSNDVSSLLVRADCSLQESMRILEKSGKGILLVVDEGRRLIGTVTDGDLRRSILKGMDLSSTVDAAMNREPVSVCEGYDIQDIRSIMVRHGLKQVPVLDEGRRVVDVVLSSRLIEIPLSIPDITDKEVQAVLQVLTTPHLSLGPKLYEFEALFARFIGSAHAVAVNSGTSGLHLCVKSLGLADGDEVITTPFSFIASANAILFERARPVFVDIDPETLCLDVVQVERAITPRTRAILPVHVFGHPCRMDELSTLAKKYRLHLIEDACEAIGAELGGRKVGTFGDCAVFAFYPNKQMTTGEGGIIVTDNESVAKLCRSYRNQGRSEGGGWLSHERIGYNYRLSELQCALGLVQIERIDEMLAKRQDVAALYGRMLGEMKGIRLPHVADDVKMSWFVYVLQLEEQQDVQRKRDEILALLRREGIACNNYFPPIHLQPFYAMSQGYREGSYPVTEGVSRRTIALPFYNNLHATDVERICEAFGSAVRRVCQ